ncbi:MAG: hypothetical protein V7L20_00185 [Nostoc sp.]|uniref:hypothetical protein n=1 Tax=Nostoc sp. TaxID=1180 RepID=UPI002FF57E6F
MTDKARRTSIQIAGIEVEAFQMPNGDYVMSQTQVARAIGLSETGFRRFLKENQPEPLIDKGLGFDKLSVSTAAGQIKAVSIDTASDFWMAQAFKGNVKAQAFVAACMQEAL